MELLLPSNLIYDRARLAYRINEANQGVIFVDRRERDRSIHLARSTLATMMGERRQGPLVMVIPCLQGTLNDLDVTLYALQLLETTMKRFYIF